jgi:hypothetical protein
MPASNVGVTGFKGSTFKGSNFAGCWSLAACCWLLVIGQLPEARNQRPERVTLNPEPMNLLTFGGDKDARESPNCG